MLAIRLGVERRREAYTRTRRPLPWWLKLRSDHSGKELEERLVVRPYLGDLVAHLGGGIVFVTWWLKGRDRVPIGSISFVELQRGLGVAFMPSIPREKIHMLTLLSLPYLRFRIYLLAINLFR